MRAIESVRFHCWYLQEVRQNLRSYQQLRYAQIDGVPVRATSLIDSISDY